ncbi:MAG: hypothetical protein JWL69_3635 [Phycisphaerales bacterium]|nr:hypothetical protein [Phycisphaerales bacterium]
MLNDKRLQEIRDTCQKASRGPWDWGYESVEEPTDDPELLASGIDTIPAGFKHIQLKANGQHRFWIELTDTQLAGDVVFDFDFIVGAREWVPELLAEIERLRGLLGRDAERID